MRNRKLEQTLAIALDTGTVPPDASAEDRQELDGLLQAVTLIRAGASLAASEAATSMASARSRFQRSMVAARPLSALPANRRPRFVSGIRGTTGILVATASAVAIVVMALAIGLAVQVWRDSAETAFAMEPGDYVQVEGVVTSDGLTDDGTISVDTAVGTVELAISPDTSLGAEGATLDPAALQPGEAVFFAGLVGEQRQVRASSLSRTGGTPPVDGPAVRPLAQFRDGLQGSIISVALSGDGQSGRVVLALPSGDRLLVPVPAATVERLLQLEDGPLGTPVRVLPGDGGLFSLEAAGAPVRPAPDRLVIGVVSSEDSGRLTITKRGPSAEVVVRESTLVRSPGGQPPPESLVGHVITAVGTRDAEGTLQADLILVGRDLRPGNGTQAPPGR